MLKRIAAVFAAVSGFLLVSVPAFATAHLTPVKNAADTMKADVLEIFTYILPIAVGLWVLYLGVRKVRGFIS